MISDVASLFHARQVLACKSVAICNAREFKTVKARNCSDVQYAKSATKVASTAYPEYSCWGHSAKAEQPVASR
eukprot:CAMPEP_0180801092 /NCGR_PEP_ID=MMETSP1038_2-20121128/59458_1 /TAXON_ID=632150 /ORGANISM="Azadinium spinosum, Strain 3D9" /LENGTH=72 /DNA_ID=CAMNT_0022840875 /DNA_START=124 /DNA_END=342 /DNA_ORIENTATION=+